MANISTERIRRGRKGVAALAALSMLPALLVALIPSERAEAALPNPVTFDPGNIISDDNFYDGSAMTESQIQAFLVARGSALASYRSTVANRAAYISDQARPGHVYCQAFQGGSNLLASTIIFRAQQACGISAKVLLVTLQKEQGLITRSTASESAVRIAMGYGCPDTAPCNELYYGFGNQLYMASRQFKVYQLPENRFRYHPGNVYVQYHPNTACGGTTVNIKNWATAGLYNYTPYQPNSAAMHSYPGTGDSCSSYGNRNFWFFYSDWFGDPAATSGAAAIALAHDLAGGPNGLLGRAVATLNCPPSSTSCWQDFEHGIIGWTKSGGAHVVSGVIADSYRSRGGPANAMGYPLDSGKSFETVNGDGVVQVFQGGYLYSSDAGVFRVINRSPVEFHWIADGWVRGSLGWPVSELECGSAGCIQQFQGGYIGGPSKTVVHPVVGALADSYENRGGSAGVLGYPLDPGKPFETANGNGVVQIFQGGYLYSSNAGVFRVANRSAIEAAWIAQGWVRGSLGWPIGEETCGPTGCTQAFQGGTVSSSGGVGWPVTDREILAYYEASGGASGVLGQPRDPGKSFDTANGDGIVQIFEGGYLYSSAAGVFRVVHKSPVESNWIAQGWIRGALGWPVAEMQCAASGCTQQFQGGVVSSSGEVFWPVTDPDIKSYYDANGGPAGALGNALDAGKSFETVNGNGVVQIFQGGYLYSSDAGVFRVVNRSPVEAHWISDGWIRGSLGWPVSELECGSTGCLQRFQGGYVGGPSQSAVYPVTGVLAKSYEDRDGPSGVLGYPLDPGKPFETVNGNGVVQIFQGGYLYSSAAGVFRVEHRSLIETAWIARGWIRGPMGWPVGEQVCGEAGCSQQFQGGPLHK
ncbi:hypothetical protein [Cryobacterium sp. BB307]|uniref:hypothetical protein n=1 Tax=Cryobacterium sp. BB307 TaxID=2716317 RepID=UPI0014466164